MTEASPYHSTFYNNCRRFYLHCVSVSKVSHHGSNNFSSLEFSSVVNPQLAVISVGTDNDYGHPAAETLERLMNRIVSDKIYRTDENGTIELITNGERLWIKTERK